LVTTFDESLPKIKVIPHDIGRVLLNLINNAFQAIYDSKNLDRTEKYPKGLRALKGVVKITSENLGDQIQITVSDNGPGIPDDIKDKIFQPFFTTKPTGQGTGLGLSLAYDIVKTHGGEISVKSKTGMGTDFIINLPY
jgi:signal transduction histidine kinase